MLAAASPPAALPSFYGPRSFSIPTSEPVTSSLLQSQVAEQAALKRLLHARAQAAAVGELGQSYRLKKAERIAKAKRHMQATSISAAQSAEIQIKQQKRLLEAAQLGPGAEPSYFSGDHLIEDNKRERSRSPRHYSDAEAFGAEREHETTEEKQSPSPVSSPGRRRRRGGGNNKESSPSRSGDGHQQLQQPTWDSSKPVERSPAWLAREGLHAHTALVRRGSAGGGTLGGIGGSTVGEKEIPMSPNTQRWNRRVEKMMLERGTGGAMEEDQRAMKRAQLEAERARLLRLRAQVAGGSEARADFQGQHDSSFSSEYGGDTTDFLNQAAFLNPGEQLTNSAVLDPSFHASVRSYNQQWWVRLHNSENKTNSSPYYIGNKSIYYQTREKKIREKETARETKNEKIQEFLTELKKKPTPAGMQTRPGTQEATETKERDEEGSHTRGKTEANSSFPFLAPLSHPAASEHPSEPGLKRFVHSSSLDAPPATARARLSSAPAGAASEGGMTPAATAGNRSGAATSRALGKQHGSSFAGSTQSERLSFLRSSLASRPLPPRAASNLNPSWATQRSVLTWCRKPSAGSMTLHDSSPISAAVGASNNISHLQELIRQSQASHPGQVITLPSGLTWDELEDAARAAAEATMAARRAKAKAAHAKFQYDRVSELHGFLSQKNIRALLRQTNYNRRELYVIYVRFKALCALSPTPQGIDKHTFKKGVARLAVEDDRFVNRVFSLVDDDGSGQIEWSEFLTAMSALEKGDLEAKTRFFFQIYDLGKQYSNNFRVRFDGLGFD
jgi:hypothetical protein